MSDHDKTFESIGSFAESLQLLNQQAVQEYTPIIENILRSRSRDTNHIEHTLDGLLSFCGYEPALALYKKLCRHYWNLDKAATAYHINAYREMWDSEEKQENENAPKIPNGNDV
jgi:hypothetical protein